MKQQQQQEELILHQSPQAAQQQSFFAQAGGSVHQHSPLQQQQQPLQQQQQQAAQDSPSLVDRAMTLPSSSESNRTSGAFATETRSIVRKAFRGPMHSSCHLRVRAFTYCSVCAHAWL
jgi:hypothetical protein